jgi:uncharacterized protein involved in cysteine biosynthesis
MNLVFLHKPLKLLTGWKNVSFWKMIPLLNEVFMPALICAEYNCLEAVGREHTHTELVHASH